MSVEDDGTVRHVTFDQQLPWDARARYVCVSERQFGREVNDRLPPNSKEEIRLIREIREAAEQEVGPQVVRKFLESPEENPGEGKWFYVLNFLRIAATERDAS